MSRQRALLHLRRRQPRPTADRAYRHQVTASFDNSLTPSGPRHCNLSNRGPFPAPDGNSYNTAARSSPRPPRSTGTTVTFTVNAVDEDRCPIRVLGQRHGHLRQHAPAGRYHITNTPNSRLCDLGTDLRVVPATLRTHQVYTAGGQLFRLSAPLESGRCKGTPGASWWQHHGRLTDYPRRSPDTNAPSGFCYQYQYVVSDNVGNTSTVHDTTRQSNMTLRIRPSPC